jgi:hypothetical protein
MPGILHLWQLGRSIPSGRDAAISNRPFRRVSTIAPLFRSVARSITCATQSAGTARSVTISAARTQSSAMTLPAVRRTLAFALLLFVSAFALTNSLRMASIIAADQTAARVDRQTVGVQTADHALDAARAKRDEACGKGQGKTVACQARQAEVAKLEAAQAQATAKVAAQAKPEATDFAGLVAWASGGRRPTGCAGFRHALAAVPDLSAANRRVGADAGAAVIDPGLLFSRAFARTAGGIISIWPSSASGPGRRRSRL